jgi:tripartite-type tricarboxylate transporter receptor subunit TctC
MRLSRRKALKLLTALGAPMIVSHRAAAQSYPERPIRLIVPFPAGGTVDVVTRLVAARMAEDLRQPFVIENRSGAGGVIATDAVAKAAPDGYTLLITSPNHTINAALQPSLPYDTEKDLSPVALAAEVPELLVSHPDAPFRDFAGFLSYAKANPGKLNYASAGNGTLPHVTMELLLRGFALSVTHIPYRGAAPAMTDLLAGQVQIKLDTYTTAASHVAAGKLRVLAYAGKTRLGLMPDVPTVAELGLPGYEGVLWMGLLAPARTPPPVIEKLAAAVKRAVSAPELSARLRRDGVDPIGSSPAEFAALIRSEIAQWRALAKSASIRLD